MSDSFKTRQSLAVGGQSYEIFSLPALKGRDLGRLPFSLKILLENLLRFEDGVNVTREDIEALLDWDAKASAEPRDRVHAGARDHAGLHRRPGGRGPRRDARGDDATRRQPAGHQPARARRARHRPLGAGGRLRRGRLAGERNNAIEFDRNGERYAFLRWGQTAFSNFKVVPPNTGIVHQVNRRVPRARRVRRRQGRREAGLPGHAGRHRLAHHDGQRPGRARLGRGRHRGRGRDAGPAGDDADSAGHRLPADRRAARRRDRHRPRAHGHRDAAQEGRGRQVRRVLRRRPRRLPLADRATIANMAPEFGSTCGIFPIDEETMRYLELTGRPPEQIALVEAYAKAQGMWRTNGMREADYTDVLELDLATVEPSLAGPKRPQDRVPLRTSKEAYRRAPREDGRGAHAEEPGGDGQRVGRHGGRRVLRRQGRRGADRGHHQLHQHLQPRGADRRPASSRATRTARPHRRSPGSRPASRRARGSSPITSNAAGLLTELEAVGFYLVGYGCTTCIGNSGPLRPEISEAVKAGDVIATSCSRATATSKAACTRK